MSTITVGLPQAYPWVLAVASAVPFLTFWQMTLVGKARRASGIKYPQMYATTSEEGSNVHARAFNCTQRAHQNTMENVPQFLVTLLIAGLALPRASAVFGVIYLAGRTMFTLGYATGDPAKRVPGGMVSYLGLLPLIFSSVYSAFSLLKQTNFYF